ncbi:MAG TPA: hypothetical protein VNY52_10220 [Solirubrobacteraceae bacterium]|nr:hypothetical protein [Solirubrobacteraceae bacterium]
MDWAHIEKFVVERGLIAAVLLLAGVAVAGCGRSSTDAAVGTSSEHAPSSSSSSPSSSGPSSSPVAPPSGPSAARTPTQRPTAQSTVRPPPVTVKLSVLGVGPEPANLIPKNNTCDGANVPLSFTWSAVPHGTAELVLFVINIRPVRESAFVDWAVAGLRPSSRGITAGTLPPGALAGVNSLGRVGYSICPPKGTSETYIARLVALAHPLAARSGFDGKTLFMEAERAAKAIGVTGAGSYSR